MIGILVKNRLRSFIGTVIGKSKSGGVKQASKAKIIISKSGELLSYSAYRKLMAEEN